MKVPPGLTVSSPSLVCKLKKSLYGLKQASRQWYARLSVALRTKGFIPSKNDYSLFLRKSGDKTVMVVVYVDDILVTGDDVSQIVSLKTFLDEEFKIKDLGQLSFFLGLEFQKTDKGMVIHQQKYIKELLDLYSIHSSKTVTMPLPQKPQLLSNMPDPLPDASIYRQLIGKLNFLLHTRPDLSFSVQHLSQFNQNPCQSHYDAAIHVLQYLHDTSTHGLFFNSDSSFKVEAYCDSDWAAFSITRKYVSGFFIMFGDCPISWKSKKAKHYFIVFIGSRVSIYAKGMFRIGMDKLSSH